MIKNSKRLALQWLILLVIIAAMLFGIVKGAIWYFDMLLDRNAMYAQGQTEIITDHEAELKAQWNKDGER